ncbi:hypothetical protein SEF58_10175 [Neomoorella humiferrea]|nr:hypothetical protein [Moorella humiferrea]
MLSSPLPQPRAVLLLARAINPAFNFLARTRSKVGVTGMQLNFYFPASTV